MTIGRAETKAGGDKVCQKCGARIFAEGAGGFCRACLLEAGLHLLQGEESEEKNRPILAEFGDYQLLEEIGRGGQGVVYRARQKSLNRLVALKLIGLGHGASETHIKRFRREAEAAARLEHPRITPIYEIGERDGTCYFSMKLEEGGQLDRLVRQESISLRRAGEIIASLARTVHYAHERGILHRDIKPGNILLDAQGEPHLADFGLVRLVETDSTVTRTREVLGTPSYIAPEQAAGQNEKICRATDVYGLGAVFYQLLTGHPPFAGGTTYETIRLVLETEPRNPRLWNAKVDRDLTTICLKCLEKEPARRYSSALELAEDLERWLKHEPIRARRGGFLYRAGKWLRRNSARVALCSLGAGLLGTVVFLIWNRTPSPPPAGIAVLPFANLDGKKDNVAFAAGVQNDILARLASIPDLHVISRTSVMQYRGAQNARKIGQALHVSHILEGGVRRDNNRIHLDVELVDTHTDQPLWGERFERDLGDVAAAQSGIAHDVAEVLRLELSPGAKAALESRPTKDLQAYDLYSLGAPLVDSMLGDTDVYATNNSDIRAIRHAIELLDKAVARDPKFFLAYCKLAKAHDFLSLATDSSTDFAKAQAAINNATDLAPNSGETHLARALHLYWGKRDYNGSHMELALARRTLPNDPRIPQLSGYVDRREGRWDEAVRDFRRALDLDPQNNAILHNLEATYNHLRRYDDEAAILDRGLALTPHDVGLRVHRAGIEIRSRADVRPLTRMLQDFVAEDPSSLKNFGWPRFELALYRRDLSEAEDFLTRAEGSNPLARAQDIDFPHSFFEGLLATLKGDTKKARERFAIARLEEEKAAASKTLPNHLVVTGLIDAFLGRKEEALAEGGRAMKLMPLSRDGWDGPQIMFCFAAICTWTGERDSAVTQLQQLAQIPAGVHYGHLVLDPLWDPLRSDPRFQQIIASLRPQP